ncbi:hypothetical protein Poli38472_003792 [Pythium oligandrum]|uniref:TRP C-terminal domain-containing protein n=1 Tax=Pythium oligandrum TaxID=41045 RepID=A0A8K1CP49_PYTOL|nr:hypothetical protein Poli38472_003792 [Pythium oligandrum]|eukprot:TMW66027.1 hypothetical protein Poli38472_003792 [Pythium oligandrum]
MRNMRPFLLNVAVVAAVISSPVRAATDGSSDGGLVITLPPVSIAPITLPPLLTPKPTSAAPKPTSAAPKPTSAAPTPTTATPTPSETSPPETSAPETTSPPTWTPGPFPTPTWTPWTPVPTATPPPGPVPTSTPEPTHTETPRPTEPTPPPPTDEPTPSPTPPTKTPSPTSTPTPTPTSTDDGPDSPSPPTKTPSPTPTEEPSPSPPTKVRPTPTPPSPTSEAPSSPAPVSKNDGKKDDDSDDTESPAPPGASPSTPAESPTAPSPSTTPKPVDNIEVTASPDVTVVLPVGTVAATTTEPPRRYVRGDDVVADTNAPGNYESGTLIMGGSPAVVLGGAKAASNGAGTNSKDEADVFEFLRNFASVCAIMSLLLLLAFHGAALDKRLTTAWALGSPNMWETMVYIGYIQSMASLGHLVLHKVPYFLWKYTDAFSWTVGVPLHGSAPAIGPRRLLEVVFLDGVVAFADRIGINESGLLSKVVGGILLIVGFMLVALVTVVVAVRLRTKKQREFNPAASMNTVQRNRLPMHMMGGVGVLVWLFALYPVSLASAYEITMQVKSGKIASGSLTMALLLFVLICVGGLALAITAISMMSSAHELHETKNMAIWGSVLGEVRYERRLFFVGFAAVQIASGVIVAAVQGSYAQLVLLLILHIGYVVAAWRLNPFTKRSIAMAFTYCFSLIKIVNLIVAFSFVRTEADEALTNEEYAKSTAGTPGRMARVFVILNSIIIIFWFARHFGMLCRMLSSMWATRAAADKLDKVEKDEYLTTTTMSVVTYVSLPGEEESQRVMTRTAL